jgi:hypothetical protein
LDLCGGGGIEFECGFDFEEISPPLMLEGRREVSRVGGSSSLMVILIASLFGLKQCVM